MHRRMQFAGQHRRADLRNERAALAAMRQQLAGLVEIACGFELDDLDIESGTAAVRRRAISSVCASAIALLRVPIFEIA